MVRWLVMLVIYLFSSYRQVRCPSRLMADNFICVGIMPLKGKAGVDRGLEEEACIRKRTKR